ncbi:Zinc dependent phospholipase C [Thiothrix caldifontis]|uniref:Zinc dependent phospholipase C n=1 Tax=Thiothrix caldifontis TaxID=525918 RepID=A0A1H4AMX9_9GAMM|nr:zinc dependent phospholipase C family protein [Thiothrix caldifontis]SEA37178.1 Zinc dependent phospholipase C [Thiothrix caldifontis]
MPAVLTHKAIMLLARERINTIRAVLQHRIDTGAASVTTLERQLLAIATEASRIFSSDPRPRTQLPGVLFAPPVGNDLRSYPISQFAVMGSMGPDITGFSGLLSPGHAWVFDTVHKGTPDTNRELVNAQSCDLILEFWAQVKQRITAEVAALPARNHTLDTMRAFVLGHVCHIAADVVSHPYVNGIQWQTVEDGIEKFHAPTERNMEAYIARTVLGRSSTRSGQAWDLWWPTSDEVPRQFFSAWEEALKAVYKAGDGSRPGYQPFVENLASLDPPTMNTDFIKDGYHMYRHGVLPIGYGYGFWSWWGWLALFFVPALVLPLVVAAMPRGGQIFLADGSKRTGRSYLEYLATPLAFGLPASIGLGALIGSLSTHGIGGRYWLGMVGLIIAGILATVLFTTLGADNLPAGFSWTVLFALPAGIASLQVLLASIDGAHGQRGGQLGLALVFALPPLVMFALFLYFFGLLFPVTMKPESSAHTAFEDMAFWVAFAQWALVMLGLWFSQSCRLRDEFIPEKPAENNAPADDEQPSENNNPADNSVKRRFVGLFDDTTLHHDMRPIVSDRAVLSEVYPSGYRPLVKLWWTGSGELFVRSDRFQLVFSASEDGSDPQIVPAPIAPMTLAEFIEFLSNTVKQPGGNTTGLLKGEIVHPDNPENPGNPDYELPSGATFADHGDAKDSLEDHDAEAAIFKKLGSSADDTDYTLYHAPKFAQAVGYGRNGPVPPARNLGGTPLTHDPEQEGYEYIHDPAKSSSSDALMSVAADFAAILCLGATTHMSPMQDSGGNNIEKIYQVFRNWSLDRRRVNEWRMIVAGGALNEKGSNRSGYDSKMPAHQGPTDPSAWRSRLLGAGAAGQTAFDEGEQTARQLGWVKLLREWLEVTRTSGQNPLDTNAMRPGNPSNQALNRGMAWLFDLVDPTPAP